MPPVNTKVPLHEEVPLQIQKSLPNNWFCFPEKEGICVLLLSSDGEKTTQRRLYFPYSGIEEVVVVHRKPLPADVEKDFFMKCTHERVALTEETKSKFILRVLNVVENLRKYDICVGVNDDEFQNIWEVQANGEVDRNPYGEKTYKQTFRPFDCHLIVSLAVRFKTRCTVCTDHRKYFQRKLGRKTDVPHPSTRNTFLTRDELLDKVEKKQEDLKYARAQIKKLKAEMKSKIKEEGVCIEDGWSQEFCNILKNAKLSPGQELFVNEQLKAASVAKANGRRWHPTMIRFALLLKSTSTAAYRAVADSGMITLPSESTLFDYSHFSMPEEGCTKEKLNRVCKLLEEKYPESYQKYHVLMMDEVHINKKLVYQKSSGEMIGYVNLTDAEEELAKFEAQLKGEKLEETPKMASKVLAFLIRGVASSLTEVVATYPTHDNLDADALYDKVWEVIGALERSGVKIIAVVSDGASVNRTLYKSHPPLTKTSNLVFDTVNLAAPSRPLYFLSDVPHLLKTIRNGFYKSGSGRNCTRLLTKNNQVIVWQTIRKLFDEDKSNNLRRCYKLNAQNVNLNAYSVMKVNYAAQVMSNTVALDLRSRNWPGTSETVKFIKEVNDFFDRLNGSRIDEGHRKRNKNLEPYRDVDDERFDQLLSFVEYLKDWKAEVDAKPGFTAAEKAKMTLSQQTVEGIEITVRSFVGATRFLLKNVGVKYLNARVFCQDPIERYFSKQRQMGGGNRNPTVAQFLSNELKIGVHRDLNVRRSNVEGKRKHMPVDSEPLPKRRRK